MIHVIPLVICVNYLAAEMGLIYFVFQSMAGLADRIDRSDDYTQLAKEVDGGRYVDMGMCN
jgi:hypothetical protein